MGFMDDDLQSDFFFIFLFIFVSFSIIFRSNSKAAPPPLLFSDVNGRPKIPWGKERNRAFFRIQEMAKIRRQKKEKPSHALKNGLGGSRSRSRVAGF